MKGFPSSPYAWNAAKARAELVLPINGTDNFVWDANPANKVDFTFQGCYDDGVNQQLFTTGGLLGIARVGVSAINAINVIDGGISTYTGMALNNSITLMSGGPGGNAFPFNVSRSINAYFRFRLPNVADLTNHYVLIGLYNAVNAYAYLIFNDTVDGNWRFNNQNGGAVTSDIVAAADNNWHKIHMILTVTSIKLVYDGGATINHVANIPVGDLQFRMYNKDQTGAVMETVDLQQVKILQDAP